MRVDKLGKYTDSKSFEEDDRQLIKDFSTTMARFLVPLLAEMETSGLDAAAFLAQRFEPMLPTLAREPQLREALRRWQVMVENSTQRKAD